MDTLEKQLVVRANKIAEMPQERYDLFLKFLSEHGKSAIHDFAIDARRKREG